MRQSGLASCHKIKHLFKKTFPLKKNHMDALNAPGRYFVLENRSIPCISPNILLQAKKTSYVKTNKSCVTNGRFRLYCTAERYNWETMMLRISCHIKCIRAGVHTRQLEYGTSRVCSSPGKNTLLLTQPIFICSAKY